MQEEILERIAALQALSQTMAMAQLESPDTRSPGNLLDPDQAHHLNQDSMYRDRIPHADGVTVKLEGNAFTEPGTPHYLVHQAQEEFLNRFRRRGPGFGDPPTNLEMTRSIVDALRRAGYSDEQVRTLVRAAIQDRVKYHLLGGELAPRIPGRINQKKPDATDEP